MNRPKIVTTAARTAAVWPAHGRQIHAQNQSAYRSRDSQNFWGEGTNQAKKTNATHQTLIF